MKRITTKAPGKLYVAGEYAVVEANYSAIITTVNRFVTVHIQSNHKQYGTFYSHDFTDRVKKIYRNPQTKHFMFANPNYKYVFSAIQTVETYAIEQNIELKFYDLEIESELIDQKNIKLGLGSSGAVTIAIIQSLLEFYEINYNNLLLFKLGVIAQLKLDVNSSFGDLAAISHTGWIKYTNFDHRVVKEMIKNYSITNVVHANWPYLNIEPISYPVELNFLIGWTGSPASSNVLVGNVQDHKKNSPENYLQFLKTSQESVNQLEYGFSQYSKNDIICAINKNRKALLQMGREANTSIETNKLTELIDIANKYNCPSKTSGAGGGDSGIAFAFHSDHILSIKNEWKKRNITLLPLTVYEKNYFMEDMYEQTK